MIYIYESCVGYPFLSNHELSYEERYCEQCGDTQSLIGTVKTEEEANEFIKSYFDVEEDDDY